MLEDILPYLGYEPSFTDEEKAEQEDVTVQTYLGEKPHEAQSKIRNAGLKTEIIGQGTSVLKQIPEPARHCRTAERLFCIPIRAKQIVLEQYRMLLDAAYRMQTR